MNYTYKFLNGKVYIFDGNENTDIRDIGLVKVAIEYPETRLGTVELVRVELYDENENFICNDNDIINSEIWHNKDDVRVSLVKKYAVSPEIVFVLE
uniref:Uncharacterized protein n=1 Tax=uncultured Bacillota bacterium TaxID=344338 RepID=A0A650EN29_9FIRM|nr:hypothetical protein Firmicute1046_1390 [uncultured Firmicutes bacterium]